MVSSVKAIGVVFSKTCRVLKGNNKKENIKAYYISCVLSRFKKHDQEFQPPQKILVVFFSQRQVLFVFHPLEALTNGMVRFLYRSRSQVYRRIRPGALGGWEDWIAKQSKKCVGVHKLLVCLYVYYMCMYTKSYMVI